MAAVSATGIVVSFKDNGGSPAYAVVAGLRSRSIKMGAEIVDVTHADTSGRWRTLLDAAGVQSMSITGAGVFTDSSAEGEMVEAQMAGSVRDAKILIPGYGTFEGPFKVTDLEIGGEYNREVTFSATLESAGAVTFTAA